MAGEGFNAICTMIADAFHDDSTDRGENWRTEGLGRERGVRYCACRSHITCWGRCHPGSPPLSESTGAPSGGWPAARTILGRVRPKNPRVPLWHPSRATSYRRALVQNRRCPAAATQLMPPGGLTPLPETRVRLSRSNTLGENAAIFPRRFSAELLLAHSCRGPTGFHMKLLAKRASSKTQFLRGVGILVGGTAAAQACMVFVLPLLTRLYTPEDFGVLAVYTSVLTIATSIACLRFEIAIPIPESDEEAANVLALAALFPFCIASLLAVLLPMYGPSFALLTNQGQIIPYLWLIPLGVWLSGSYQAAQYWATRQQQYYLVSATRFTQALGGAATQAGFGWLGLGPLGLLLGYIVNSSAGIIKLGRSILLQNRSIFCHVTPNTMMLAFRKYHKFPKYSTFEALANTSGFQLPIIMIASFAGGPEVGFLMLATRVIAAPMGLIGRAVSQVYISSASVAYGRGNLSKHTTDVIDGLCKTGVGPLIFAGIVAPHVFPLLFGPEWVRAGEILRWMTPWFVLQFLVSPVSMTLHVTGDQLISLALQIAGLILRLCAVITGGLFFATFVVEIYAISGFLFYAIYLVVVARIAGIPLSNLFRALRHEKILTAWALAAVIVSNLLKTT